MRRISVVGSSASGKTTIARALEARLGLPRLELDAVFHQPGWQAKPDEDFRAEVAAFAAGDRWVIDGNYTSHGVAQVVWPRADAVVWLDLSRAVVMARVVRRTLRRVVTREELWNGNREPWSNLYSTKAEKNIIVWAWTRFAHTRTKYHAMLTDGTWSHLEVVRLRSARAADAFLEGLEPRRIPYAAGMTSDTTSERSHEDESRRASEDAERKQRQESLEAEERRMADHAEAETRRTQERKDDDDRRRQTGDSG